MMKKIKVGIALLALLVSGTAVASCINNVVRTNPNSIYTDHDNSTVTDNQTGLMWMQCSQGLSGSGCATGSATLMNWKQAMEAAQAANSGGGTFGYTDWRLPNIKELESLVERACYSPSINARHFPATVGSFYWSSSLSYIPNNGQVVWSVYFLIGNVISHGKAYKGYVRLVRGGQ